MSDQAITTIPARSTRDADGAESELFIVGLNCEPSLVQLGRARVLFGRDPSCDVLLGTGQASRQHAEVVRVGPLHLIRDLSSTNGTLVNGQRVREAPLVAGTLIRLGDWIGVVAAPEPTPAYDFSFCEQAPGLWGASTLRTALAPGRVAATSDLPIIVEGETGTGKELIARAIHTWSGRSGPFVAINCAALPDALAEAELFGYRRGAFTGAERASPGHFRSADGGTLLLDEVCELSPAMQVKLLRALEQREVVPLGESRPVPIDVRVLAAAQAPLAPAIARQRFRADLYARLDGLTLRIPPLRKRIEDLPRLVEHFMQEWRPGLRVRMSVNALDSLCCYDWPFNVRELRQLSRRLAVLHADAEFVHNGQLPEHIRGRTNSISASAPESPDQKAESELDRLLNALRKHAGNVTLAARDAGLSRMRAYRIMKANPDVDLNEFRTSDDEADS